VLAIVVEANVCFEDACSWRVCEEGAHVDNRDEQEAKHHERYPRLLPWQ
jgi:hypothetical protein